MIRKVLVLLLLLFGSVGVLVLVGIIVVFLFLDSVIVASVCWRVGDLSKIADRVVPNSVGRGTLWGTRTSGKKGLDRIKEELLLLFRKQTKRILQLTTERNCSFFPE